MKAILLKPYSIWTEPLTKESIDGKYIALFTFYSDIWKEGSGCIFGISDAVMKTLVLNKFAIYIE